MEERNQTEQKFAKTQQQWLNKYEKKHGTDAKNEINDILQKLFHQADPTSKFRNDARVEIFAGIQKQDITFHTGIIANEFYVKYKGKTILHIDGKQRKTFGTDIKRQLFGSKCKQDKNTIKINTKKEKDTNILDDIILKTRVDAGISSKERINALLKASNKSKGIPERQNFYKKIISQEIERMKKYKTAVKNVKDYQEQKQMNKDFNKMTAETKKVMENINKEIKKNISKDNKWIKEKSQQELVKQNIKKQQMINEFLQANKQDNQTIEDELKQLQQEINEERKTNKQQMIKKILQASNQDDQDVEDELKQLQQEINEERKTNKQQTSNQEKTEEQDLLDYINDTGIYTKQPTPQEPKPQQQKPTLSCFYAKQPASQKQQSHGLANFIEQKKMERQKIIQQFQAQQQKNKYVILNSFFQRPKRNIDNNIIYNLPSITQSQQNKYPNL